MRLVKSAERATGKSGFFTVLGTSIVHLYSHVRPTTMLTRAKARLYASVELPLLQQNLPESAYSAAVNREL